MIFAISRLSKKVLHSFDWWGEPVAPLNLRGQTVYTTSCGGLTGLVIAVLILWFTQIKFQKLFNRDEPYLTQIQQPLDLVAPDTPAYNFAENHFALGISVRKWKFDWNWGYRYEEVDIEDIFSIYKHEYSYDSGYQSRDVEGGKCRSKDIAANSVCLRDVALKGSIESDTALTTWVTFWLTDCVHERETCTEKQN